MASTPAPGLLELIREFVNTLDVERGVDDVAAWLGPAADEQAVEDARRLREALRAILLAHHGDEAPPRAAVTTVNAFADEAVLRVRLGRDGTPRLEPAGGADRWARLLLAVHEAAAEGTWRRLKVCPADDCRWAFYDASKNRSKTWCSMEVCGNRAKARAYRERQRPSEA